MPFNHFNQLMKPFHLFIFPFLLAGLISGAAGLMAQDIDVEEMITRHSIDCEDIARSSTSMIPGYYQEEKTDTLQAILRYWEESCGITEPMMRFTILWQIETNTFNEDWLPDLLPAMLMDYREATESDTDTHDYFHFGEWEYHTIDEGYRQFTSSMAQSLQVYEDLSPVEIFFTEFYGNDFTRAMSRLKNGELEGTRVDSLYTDYIEETREVRPAGYAFGGIYFGFWNPSGNLDAMGVHPQLGMSVDVVRGRALYGIQLRLGFGDTSRPYTTEVGGSFVSTNNFLQMTAGLQAGIDLLNRPGHSLFMTGGLAYDAIDPASTADREAGLTGDLQTLNLHAGMTLHRRFDRGNLFAISVNYHIVDYDNPGGTDLSGNVITFGVAYGIMTRTYDSASR